MQQPYTAKPSTAKAKPGGKVPPPIPPRNRPSSASAAQNPPTSAPPTTQSFNYAQHKLGMIQTNDYPLNPQQKVQSQSANSSPKLPSSPRYRYEFVHYPQQPQGSPKPVDESKLKSFPAGAMSASFDGTKKQSSLHIPIGDYHLKQHSLDSAGNSSMYRSYATPVLFPQTSSQTSSSSMNGVQLDSHNGLPQSVQSDNTTIQQRLAQYPKTIQPFPNSATGFGHAKTHSPVTAPGVLNTSMDNNQLSTSMERSYTGRVTDNFSPMSSPHRFVRDGNRQASFLAPGERPVIPPRSLSLERPSTLLSPQKQPRHPPSNLVLAQSSPKSPRSRLQLLSYNSPSRGSPGMSPSKLAYNNQPGSQAPQPPNQLNSISPQTNNERQRRNSPGSFNLPLKNLSFMSNDTSSSPDSPGSFSLPGRPNFFGSPGSPAHMRTNSPGPQAANFNLGRAGRRKMDIAFPMSPSQPKTPDASEIESRYQEVMKRSGILTFDGQQISTEIEQLETLGELGHGSCGHVMKMKHMKTGHIMAVKQMRRTGNRDENKRIIMDMDVVTKCHNCPFIVQCIGTFITKSDVWICMELMSTCLEKLLKKIQQPFPEKILGKVAVATVNALNFLKEEHGVIHRDVKPSNILLDESGSIKLCDFGISGRLVDSKAKTRTGCAAYMAPERIEPPDPTRPDYDIRADVWSLGISLVELASGAFPYPNCKNDFEVLTRVLQEEPPQLPAGGEFTKEFRSFVDACLIKDFHKRPKYRALLRHQFILQFTAINVDVAQWYKQMAQIGLDCSPAFTV